MGRGGGEREAKSGACRDGVRPLSLRDRRRRKKVATPGRMPARDTDRPDPLVVAHVIGQTPRPDLTVDLRRRLPEVRLRIVGALDRVRSPDVAPAIDGDYPLETRLRDGTRVVIEAGYVAPLLQDSIDRHDPDADVHVLLCAGPFEDLSTPVDSSGRSTPLIRPFAVATEHLAARGHRRLDIVVPFRDQAAPARGKWTGAGFSCRVHVLSDRPAGTAPLAVDGGPDRGR